MHEEQSPFYTLLFFIIVFILLTFAAAFFPEEGICLHKDIRIKFPTLISLLKRGHQGPAYTAIPPEAKRADSISEQHIKKTGEAIADNSENKKKADEKTISVIEKRKEENNTPPSRRPELHTQKIEFPDNNRTSLHTFFKKLEEARHAENSLRIVHFGDSQIEGDRISGFLRERLQSRFGGGGPGLLPALKLYNQASVKQENTGNWKRYTLIGHVDKQVKHNRYGVMCAFSKFTPLEYDSTQSSTTIATVRFNTSNSIYPLARTFSRIKIFYGDNGSHAQVDVYVNNVFFQTYTLDRANGLNVLHIDLNQPVSKAELVFSAINCPDIYGISLDMPHGIAVDNIAMRGSAGTLFTKTDRHLLQSMLYELNTGLIIMQFGGNVLPYVQNEKSCIDYGNHFYSQLMMLKNALPDVAIIVIGPADMSIKEKDHYITYPLLEKVRDALKNAAFKAGAGFWDMYAAMGGQNSMPSWVAAKPPLAVSDYVHFTPKGARIIAELFYEALEYEYELYKYLQIEAKQ